MNLPRFLPSRLAVACLALLVDGFLSARAADAPDSLRAGFAQPPAAAEPRTWWHWISGNISQEGITADLEAMKAIGLGGAQIFTVDQSDVKGPVVFMSPQWRGLMRHAISESDRLGLELSMENCEGWSESGGPWVTPAQSMQKVVWAEAYVHGGGRVSLAVPQPLTIRGYYEDIALFAFPTLRGDGPADEARLTTSSSTGPVALPITLPLPTPGHPQWIQFEFPATHAASSLRFTTPIPLRDNPALPPWRLEASDDGVVFRTVCTVNNHLAASFPEVRARFFRLLLPALILPPRVSDLTFTEIALGGPRLDRVEARSGMAVDRQVNRFLPVDLPADAVIRPDSIVDLTGKTSWDAPAGDWTILRLGHTSTGITNHPASPATVGLECDKLSAAAVTAHLEGGSTGAVVGDSPGEMGRGLRYLLCDSWEAGCENWTPGMRDIFRRRVGYDPEPWLPTLTGRVVGSVESSERFLWDYRRLLADLVAENHYGTIQSYAHAHHLGLYAEAVGINMPTVADQLQCKGRTDVPMGEFWVSEDWPGQTPYDDTKEAASAAHIYGQNIAAAEAFTARSEFGAWAQDPYSLKALGDLELCLGINRFVFHRYAHQPWLDRKPGMSMGPWGTNFERTNTWWNDASAWMTYLSRCQYLLQQGHFAADVCYYYGEGAPVDVKVDDVPVPRGYDYDVCDTEILLQLSVSNGRLVLPSGMTYRVLILPDNDRMTARVARKISDLVRAGAIVVGPKPSASPSLADYPTGDAQVRAIADQVWSRVGTGSAWTREIAPDFWSDNPDLHFIHRRTDDADIYFISNQSGRATSADCLFRIDGKVPELWHPDTGAIELPALWRPHPGGRTLVPLHFDPSGSVFVVFSRSSAGVDPVIALGQTQEVGFSFQGETPPPDSLPVFRDGTIVVTEWSPGTSYEIGTASGRRYLVPAANLPSPLVISGPWNVSFPPGLGAPSQAVFPMLDSWTMSPVAGIEFFSGTATYTRAIDLPAVYFGPGMRQFLDLGTVKNLARVRLNGQDLGILWKEPFRVELTGAAHPGENHLEIEVTNLWANRMIGDSSLPPDQRVTWASYSPYHPGSPLLPSGLLGPVVIRPAVDVASQPRDRN